jgi:hypothetical protein
MGTPDSLAAHRTVIVHCPVHATSARSLGFGVVDRWNPLSFCCTGQFGGTPDSLVTSDFCAALFICAVDCWRTESRCSAGSPDSPVNYSEARPRNSREWPVRLLSDLVHRTVSSAPFSAHSQVLLQILIVSPTEFLSWFILNLIEREMCPWAISKVFW